MAPIVASELPPPTAPIRMAASTVAVDSRLARALGLDPARDVALRDVRDLVCEDAGQFAFVARLEQQPRVHADEAAGQREGVDRLVADHEEVERAAAVLRLARELEAERLDVFAHLRVLEQRAGFAHLAHDHAPEPVFVLDRQRLLRRSAHFGQVVLRGLCKPGRRAQCQGRAATRPPSQPPVR